MACRSSTWSISATAPISVDMPVAATQASARPRVTTVFMNNAPDRSARGPPSCGPPTSFSTATDSPVRLDSSTSRERATTRRASAGTRSPASRRTRSPGTSSTAGISRSWPSRRTRADATSIDRRAARLFSARFSWTNPSTAFRIRTKVMTAASLTSPTAPASTAATIRTTTRRLRNWSRNSATADRDEGSASWLGP